MKRLAFAVVVAIVFSGAFGYAQNLTSAKSAITMSSVALLGGPATQGVTTTNGWTNLLSGAIRTSEQKDLVLGVSLETGLFTSTTVRSKNGTEDTQWALANIEVQVLIDAGTANERLAAPGAVTFDKRYQELMAKFGGIWSCADADADGHMDYNECTITDEELRLVLDTMGAHHFNFALTNLGAGDHTIQVQARITTNHTAGEQSSARAAVGKGALTVEEVRLVKSAIIM